MSAAAIGVVILEDGSCASVLRSTTVPSGFRRSAVTYESINSPAQLADLCGRLARTDQIGIDTEFVSEDTFRPELGLVQVATANDLAVIDPQSLKILRRVNLGPTARKDPTLLGRYLFTTATIVKGKQFSCNSCHPDGGTDGISWKFVHVKDALGKENDRNVKALRGHIGNTAPYRWTGHEPSLAAFIEEEIPGLLQGEKPTKAEVSAMVAYVDSLPLAPNPYRAPDNSLTAVGVRGKALFEGKAGCAACHAGPHAGGQQKAWIGTTPEGVDLLVPRLDGVYDTYPYLHDGKAQTLEEVFAEQNPKKLHGKAHELSDAERKDLLEYVKEL